MRIGFDIRPFLKEETGVGVYLKNLLFSLSRIDRDNEYFLFSSSFKDRFPSEKIPPFAKRNFRDFHCPVKAVNFFWYHLKWPPLDKLFRTELDLTHSPTPLILPAKGRKITTVCDLFFWDFPELADREARKRFLKGIRASLERAQGIITISHFTRKQLLDRFSLEPDKVKVIHLGLDRGFWENIQPEESVQSLSRLNIPSTFLLFVGALEPRKNLVRLLEGLKVVHEKFGEIPLVLAGRSGEDSARVIAKIQELKLEKKVILTGYLTREDLRNLYRSASAFIFPSLCEGFGLPLLEAMAAGVPIAASRASALPEVADDAALFFDPFDPEDMAEKIIKMLDDEDLKRTLVEKGKTRVQDFDWRTTAQETLEFYQYVFEK